MKLTLGRGLLLIVLVGGGGLGAAYTAGIIALPEAGVADMGDWGAVQADAVAVETTGWVHNPNPLGLNITNITVDYTIRMAGTPLVQGQKQGIRIKEGNNTLSVTSTLAADRVPAWWASHLRQDEQSTVAAVARIQTGIIPFIPPFRNTVYTDTLSTDIIGTLDQAVGRMEATYQGPGIQTPTGTGQPTIEIRGGSAAWGRVSRDTTPLKLSVRVHNPNDYPIPTPELGGTLVMNEVAVASWTGNDVTVRNAPEDGKIDAGSTRALDFIVRIDNQHIDDWLLRHIERGERTDATVTLRLRFGFDTATFYVPQDGGMRCRFSLTTAILVDGQESTSTFDGCGSGDLPTTSRNTTTSDGLQDTVSNTTDENQTDGGLTDGLDDSLG